MCRFAGKRRIFLDRQALRDDKTGKGTGGVRIRCAVAERTNTPSARQEILQLASASGSNLSRLAGTDSRRSGRIAQIGKCESGSGKQLGRRVKKEYI